MYGNHSLIPLRESKDSGNLDVSWSIYMYIYARVCMHVAAHAHTVPATMELNVDQHMSTYIHVSTGAGSGHLCTRHFITSVYISFSALLNKNVVKQ